MSDQLSGISNYCFRWCERCPFTGRCAVYSMGQEAGDLHQYAIPAAFPALSGSFAGFRRRLGNELLREGKTLTAIEEQTPLTDGELRSTCTNLIMQYLEALESTRSLPASQDFSDPVVQARHELNWYIVLLGPKMQRALKSEEDTLDPHGDFYYYDARRTAYLIVLALARATAAVTVLLEHNVPPRGKLVDLACRFLRLSVGIRKLFPDLSLFPRPFWEDAAGRAEVLRFYGKNPPVHPFLEGMYAYAGERAPDAE